MRHAWSWAAMLCAASSVSAQAPEEAPALKRVKVVGELDQGYVAETASAGSKTELALRDVPQSITVLSDEIIRDLAPQVLDEVADYVAGVDREAVQANPYAISFFFRGFNTAGNASAYNGFREQGFHTPQSLVNIERIEFLKGPASVLYGGSNALSGLVNIVSKRPLAEALHRVEATAGSFDHLAFTADSTGPLNTERTLRYRLMAADDRDGNFVDGVDQHSRFVSPVLSWDLTPATQLELELLVQDIDRPGRIGFRLRHPVFFDLPIDINLGDTSAPGGELYRHLGRFELTHRFENGWRLRQGLFAQNVNSDDRAIQPLSLQADGRTLTRRVRNVDEYQRERYSQTELSGEARTGAVNHQWLAGAEVGRTDFGFIFRVAPYSPLDVLDPQYPGEQLGVITIPFAPTENGTEPLGLYLQDLMTLNERVKLMIGARYDRLESWTRPLDGSAPEERQDDTELSPRVGVIFRPAQATSLYASWARSFAPNFGRNASGALFDPQEGEQYEVGIKQELPSGLSLNAAVFEYRRRNVLTSDPNEPDFSIAVGEQRSRGIELEAIGRLTEYWDLIATYAYLDAEVVEDNDLPEGDRLTGVPSNTVGFFSKVNLGMWGLPRWSVSAGLAYASERESGLPNDPANPNISAADVRLPSYAKLDAGVMYEGLRYSVRLNGRNLTDEEIYDGYISTFEARAPRSVELSVALTF